MRTPRIIGIDVARGFAILGMFAAHTIPRTSEAELLVDGRPSILFATLAGVSLGLITNGAASPPARPRGYLVKAIAIRGLALFILGVGLSMLPSGVAVILDYYGVMFLAVLPLLFLPRTAIAVLAAVLAVVTPIVAGIAGTVNPEGWAGLASGYLLTGRYPALVWLPFLLVGLLCARSDLTKPSTQRWMLIGGILAAAVGYGAAAAIPGLSADAHSGSTLEILASGGFAIGLIGLLLLVAPRRPIRAILSPVAAAGSMPLTIYTAQVLVLAGCVWLAETQDWIPDYPGWPLLIGLTVGSLLFAVVWRRFLGAGPLERLLRFVAGFDRPRVATDRGRRV